MAKTEKYWITILVVILIFGFFYCKNVYDSLFEVRPGFIYHPLTDRLFFVELKPSIDMNDKWSPLIPFRSPGFVFWDIWWSNYLGKLKPLLKKNEADKKLKKNNPDAWKQKWHKEAKKEEKIFSDKLKSKDLDYWTIKYFLRWDFNRFKILPDNVSSLKTFGENTPPDFFLADVMVVHWNLTGQLIESELIREVIFFRGRAAFELNNLIEAYLVEDYR